MTALWCALLPTYPPPRTPGRQWGGRLRYSPSVSHFPDAPQDVFLLIRDLLMVLFKRLEPSISMSPHNLMLRRSEPNLSAFSGFAVGLHRLDSDLLSKIHPRDESSGHLDAVKTPNKVNLACNPSYDARISSRHSDLAVRSRPMKLALRRSSLSPPATPSKSRPMNRLVTLPRRNIWARITRTLFVETTGLCLVMLSSKW